MRDPQLDKLVNVPLHHSTKVQPRQVVRISSSVFARSLLEAA